MCNGRVISTANNTSCLLLHLEVYEERLLHRDLKYLVTQPASIEAKEIVNILLNEFVNHLNKKTNKNISSAQVRHKVIYLLTRCVHFSRSLVYLVTNPLPSSRPKQLPKHVCHKALFTYKFIISALVWFGRFISSVQMPYHFPYIRSPLIYPKLPTYLDTLCTKIYFHSIRLFHRDPLPSLSQLPI